jgi:hypothetical protein
VMARTIIRLAVTASDAVPVDATAREAGDIVAHVLKVSPYRGADMTAVPGDQNAHCSIIGGRRAGPGHGRSACGAGVRTAIITR